MIVDTFSSAAELFSGFRDYMSRPTHDRLVALRQTSWIPREGKKRRREDLARLPFFTFDADSSLHAHHLVQGMHNFHQVFLCGHDRLDRLVSRGRLVDDLGVLAAFYAFGHASVVLHREAAFCLRARHGAARAMAATHKAFRVALAANDERAGAHAAGNDTQVAFASPGRAFASDQNVLVVVAFAGHIVVVAVDGL